MTVSGTTSGMTTLAGSCAGTMSPEIVYSFTQATTGEFLATVAPSVLTGNLRPVLYVRSACSVMTDVACAGANGMNTARSLRIPSLAAGDWFLVVDGTMSSAGAYTLTAFQGTAPGDSCSTSPRAVNMGAATQTIIAGDTTGLADDFTPSGCGVAGSPDVVYQFVAPRDGMLTVSTRGAFDVALSVTDGAMCGGGTELGCSDQDLTGDNSNEVVTLAVTMGQSYWVWVNGYDAPSAGPFQVIFDLP